MCKACVKRGGNAPFVFMNTTKGYSIIELIVVMVLLGIMAVTAFPKLTGSSDYNSRTTRDQYISQLRLVQLKALNQRGVCHNLVFHTVSSVNYFGIPANTSATCGTTTAADTRVEVGSSSVTLINGSTNANILGNPKIVFDSNGVPTATGGGDCTGACKFKISANETVYMCIESQGYIHPVSVGYVCT